MASLAVQNNNPGNLKDPSTGSFRQFSSPQEGYAALLNDLQAKQTGTTTSGLGPDSTLTDFASIYAPAGDKNNPAQYAANLANNMGVRPDAKLRELDVPKWAAAVSKNEDASSPFANQQIVSGASTQTNGTDTGEVKTASADTGFPTADASTGGDSSSSDGILGLVGKGINTFLPALGDVKDLIEGKNTKTGKQLLADTALTVLPFIPGLGELGEGARLAETGAEAAKGLSSLGALGKVGGAAVEGYGVGALQNLSQGKSVGESIAPNLGTLGGALLGGGTAGLLKVGGGLLEKASGIPENIKPVLSDINDPKLYDEYINAAKARAQDVRNPSPLEVAADYTKKAASSMQTKLSDLGKAVGQAKNIEGTKPVGDVTPALQQFVTDLKDRFGLDISTSKTGKKIFIDPAEGRMKNVLTPSDQSRVKSALSQLLKLRNGGTIRQASDVIDNLDSLVDYSKKDLFGNSNDPLEGFLKSTRHNLNGIIGQSSPALAATKERFSNLADALEEVRGAGGDDLQRSELLLKRVLAGDKSQKSRQIFDTINKETGIDLVKHAVLADHAIRTIKDPSQISLLNKMLESATQQGSPTLFGTGMNVGKALLQKTLANPETIGRELVTKKAPSGLKGLVGRTLKTSISRIPAALSGQ